MRIDFISPNPDRAGCYRVKLSDESTLRLYRQTLEDFGLYAGMEMTEQQLEVLKAAAGKMSAKMRAVRIVSATNVSCRDLEQRLTRKGETEEDARQAVAWMEDDVAALPEASMRFCLALRAAPFICPELFPSGSFL